MCIRDRFRAEILTAVRERLGIQAKFSTAHHPISHGRIEHGNQTLLEMLKKFVHEHPTNWDTMLPYFLFALREVPSVSSLYSPFELVYGRKARGLLSLMREEWAGCGDELEQLGLPAAKYVEQLGQRISDALKAAGTNVKDCLLYTSDAADE